MSNHGRATTKYKCSSCPISCSTTSFEGPCNSSFAACCTAAGAVARKSYFSPRIALIDQAELMIQAGSKELSK